MAKVKILIDAESVNQNLNDYIRGQIRHILRNDTLIKSLIIEEIQRQVEKVVNNYCTHNSLATNIFSAIDQRLPDKQELARIAYQEIHEAVSKLMFPTPEDLEEFNNGTIASLFKDEIAGIKKVITEKGKQSKKKPYRKNVTRSKH